MRSSRTRSRVVKGFGSVRIVLNLTGRPSDAAAIMFSSRGLSAHPPAMPGCSVECRGLADQASHPMPHCTPDRIRVYLAPHRKGETAKQ